VKASGVVALLVASLVVAAAACNTGLGDCPAKSAVKPGGACSDDTLECPYDLAAKSCDGKKTVLATSCTCTDGAWACPGSVDCLGDGGTSD